MRGRVSSIVPLTPDIVEVRIDLDGSIVLLPGQYVKLSFQGYPSRDYSPTSPTHRSWDPSQLVFHIKVYQRGAVSSCLGGAIRTGHRVIVEGPFGGAFYRPGPTRLVLVGTTTGWAPLWAIARAARLEEPDRRMRVVVGARRSQNLYMSDALKWLRDRASAILCSLVRREHRRNRRTHRAHNGLSWDDHPRRHRLRSWCACDGRGREGEWLPLQGSVLCGPVHGEHDRTDVPRSPATGS